MKEYCIIESFRGSNTGAIVTDFKAGTKAFMSDELAKVAFEEKYIQEIKPKVAVKNVKPKGKKKRNA